MSGVLVTGARVPALGRRGRAERRAPAPHRPDRPLLPGGKGPGTGRGRRHHRDHRGAARRAKRGDEPVQGARGRVVQELIGVPRAAAAAHRHHRPRRRPDRGGRPVGRPLPLPDDLPAGGRVARGLGRDPGRPRLHARGLRLSRSPRRPRRPGSRGLRHLSPGAGLAARGRRAAGTVLPAALRRRPPTGADPGPADVHRRRDEALRAPDPGRAPRSRGARVPPGALARRPRRRGGALAARGGPRRPPSRSSGGPAPGADAPGMPGPSRCFRRCPCDTSAWSGSWTGRRRPTRTVRGRQAFIRSQVPSARASATSASSWASAPSTPFEHGSRLGSRPEVHARGSPWPRRGPAGPRPPRRARRRCG